MRLLIILMSILIITGCEPGDNRELLSDEVRYKLPNDIKNVRIHEVRLNNGEVAIIAYNPGFEITSTTTTQGGFVNMKRTFHDSSIVMENDSMILLRKVK